MKEKCRRFLSNRLAYYNWNNQLFFRQHNFETEKVKEELESIDKAMEDSLNIRFIKTTTDNVTKLGIEAWNNKRVAMKEANIDQLFSKSKELAEEEKEWSELNRITVDLMVKNKKITSELAKLQELKESRK